MYASDLKCEDNWRLEQKAGGPSLLCTIFLLKVHGVNAGTVFSELVSESRPGGRTFQVKCN